MRKTLEDLYYGNITPNTQDIAPNSKLKRAVDRVARFENQLTEQLDETEQTILAKLIESQQELDSITAMENFILGFRLGMRMMAAGRADIPQATTPTPASASSRTSWAAPRLKPRNISRRRWSRPSRWT